MISLSTIATVLCEWISAIEVFVAVVFVAALAPERWSWMRIGFGILFAAFTVWPFSWVHHIQCRQVGWLEALQSNLELVTFGMLLFTGLKILLKRYEQSS